MDLSAIQYAAGFFDADGCVTLDMRHGPRIVFSQGQKKIDILQSIQKDFGNGILELAIKASNIDNQDLYNLRYSNSEAVRIMQLLEPYLIEKKSHAKIVSQWICGYTTAKVIKAYDMVNNGELIGKYKTICECARALTTSTFTMHQPTITKCLKHNRIFGATDRLFKIHGKRIQFKEVVEESGVILENHTRLYDEWINCVKPTIDTTSITFPFHYYDLKSFETHISIPYITGFAEGDGCFCIQKNGDKFRILCTIGQRNLNILLHIMKHYNFGTIYVSTMNDKPMYEWCVYSTFALLYMNSIIDHVRSFCVLAQMQEIMKDGPTLHVKDSIKKYKANDKTSNKRARV